MGQRTSQKIIFLVQNQFSIAASAEIRVQEHSYTRLNESFGANSVGYKGDAYMDTGKIPNNPGQESFGGGAFCRPQEDPVQRFNRHTRKVGATWEDSPAVHGPDPAIS